MSRLIRIERAVTVFLILAAASFSLITIIARYFFGLGFPWSDGIFVMLTIWGGLIASATIIDKRGHICMDAVISKFPSNMQRWLTLLGDLIATFFLLFLLTLSINQLVFLFYSGGNSLLTYLPAWIEFIGIPISLVFMVIHYLVHVFRGLKGGEKG